MILSIVAGQFRDADPKTFTRIFGPHVAEELADQHQCERGEAVA